MKTEGIDFSQKFLWFDDDIWSDELIVLKKHDAVDNFVHIDLNKDPDQLKKILEWL